MGGSQGGYTIFLTDKNDKCCPIEWRSNHLRTSGQISIVNHTDSKSLVDNLSSKKKRVKFSPCKTSYRFGDGFVIRYLLWKTYSYQLILVRNHYL